MSRPLVLCYHATSPSWKYRLSVAPDVIERQLRMLLRWRLQPATAAQVAAGRRGLHVTFDDAFRSVWDIVPLLERLHIPATVFACTGFTGAPLAVDELADQLAASPTELETLDWDQLRELADRGIEIGSHTVSHPHLPRLDDADLRRELVDSRTQLEDVLGRRCRFVAYPYGDEDARVQAAAAAAGYEAGFALPGNEEKPNLFALPRVGVYERDRIGRLALKSAAALRRPTAAALRATGRR